jgi:hypothetical protein
MYLIDRIGSYLKVHLALVAYSALAVVVAVTFGWTQYNDREARQELRNAARAVIVASCERDNQAYATMRALLLAGIPEIQAQVKDGILSPAQGEANIRRVKAIAEGLPRTDCVRLGDQFVRASLEGEE